MNLQTTGRSILPVFCASAFLWPFAILDAAPQHFEKHFPVKGRPVIVMQNIANGRIEVNSWKNPEVVVVATQPSNKVSIETEQADNRVDITTNMLDLSAQPNELEANFQLTVPENSELQLKTQTGLIYVE